MAVDYQVLINFGKEALTWLVRILMGVGAIAVAYALAYLVNRQRKYNWNVRIFDRDASGNVIQQPDDKGGIFIDKKTNFRLFKLKKNKFALDPDEIPYIINHKGKKIVYLIKTGLKNYQYLKPQISSNPGLVFNVQDEDVAWAMNAWTRFKNPFKNRMLEMIMPYIGMAFVFLLIVVSLYFIFKNFGVLSETATAFRDAAAEFAKASVGTAIVE